jgi:hypothetical protein
MTTDTPRTDSFYPSDADFWEEEAKRYCSNSQYWRERAERAEKAEKEVERLRDALKSCFWATNTYDGNYARACDNVEIIVTNALKTQDNPTDK